MYNGADAYTGGTTHDFYENVFYTIVRGSIEVLCEVEATNTFIINRYYGMQALGHTWMTKQYMAHSLNVTLRTKYDGAIYQALGSSALSAYPNIEKTILCNADKSICLAMDMDRTNGISNGVNQNTSDSFIFTSTTGSMGKTYYHLFYDSSDLIEPLGGITMASGTKYHWHGTYTFFKNIASSSNLAYKNISFKDKYLNVDMLAASDETIDPNVNSSKFVETSKDGTLTIDNEDNIIMPTGINITASAYGVCKLELDE